jgi:hypothetical protein
MQCARTRCAVDGRVWGSPPLSLLLSIQWPSSSRLGTAMHPFSCITSICTPSGSGGTTVTSATSSGSGTALTMTPASLATASHGTWCVASTAGCGSVLNVVVNTFGSVARMGGTPAPTWKRTGGACCWWIRQTRCMRMLQLIVFARQRMARNYIRSWILKWVACRAPVPLCPPAQRAHSALHNHHPSSSAHSAWHCCGTTSDAPRSTPREVTRREVYAMACRAGLAQRDVRTCG